MTKAKYAKKPYIVGGALAAGVILVCFFGLLIRSTAAASTTKGMPALARQTSFGLPEIVIEGEFIDFFVEDDRLYTIGDGLNIYDIANPIQPVYLGGLEELPTNLEDIYVAGDFAFIPGFESYDVENGITIVNISEPSQPVRVGFFELTGASRIVVQGQYAYVGYGYSTGHPAAYAAGLVILDITNPFGLVELSRLSVGDPSRIKVDGDYIYTAGIACYRAGCGYPFRISDISNPESPFQVASLDPQASVFDVANEVLFISDIDAPWPELIVGLRLYTVTDPSQPEEVGFFELPKPFRYVLADDDLIFAAGDEEIWLVDILDPVQPDILGFYPYGAQEIQVEGDFLYLLTPEGDIRVLRYDELFISGWVGQPNGLPAPDMGVELHTGLVTGSFTGTYGYVGLPIGTYTISLYIPGYAYTPTYRTVQLPPSAPGQNFTVLPEPVSILVNPGMSNTLVYTDIQGVATHLSIPTNTLTATLTLTVTPTLAPSSGGMYFTGHGFTLEAAVGGVPQAAYTFTAPLSLTVELSAGDLLVISDTTALALYRRAAGAWQAVPVTCGAAPMPAGNEMFRSLCRTGTYAVYGPTWQLAMPLMVEE